MEGRCNPFASKMKIMETSNLSSVDSFVGTSGTRQRPEPALAHGMGPRDLKRKCPEPIADPASRKKPNVGTPLQIPDSCDVALIPDGYPIKTLSPETFMELTGLLLQRVDNLSGGEGISPKFGGIKQQSGACLVTCLDQSTKDWINRVAGTIILTGGVRILIEKPSFLGGKVTVTGFFPGPYPYQPQGVIRRLANQNSEIADFIKEWTILWHKDQPSGSFLVLRIPASHQTILSDKNNKLCYNFGFVNLRIKKTKKKKSRISAETEVTSGRNEAPSHLPSEGNKNPNIVRRVGVTRRSGRAPDDVHWISGPHGGGGPVTGPESTPDKPFDKKGAMTDSVLIRWTASENGHDFPRDRGGTMANSTLRSSSTRLGAASNLPCGSRDYAMTDSNYWTRSGSAPDKPFNEKGMMADPVLIRWTASGKGPDVSWDRGSSMTDPTSRSQPTRSGAAVNESWGRDSERSGSTRKRPAGSLDMASDVPWDRLIKSTRPEAIADKTLHRVSEASGYTQRRPPASSEVCRDVSRNRGGTTDPTLRNQPKTSRVTADEPWGRGSEETRYTQRRSPVSSEVPPDVQWDRDGMTTDPTLRRKPTNSWEAVNEPWYRGSGMSESTQRRPPERYEVASDVSWDRGGTMTDATLRRQHTRSGAAANEPWDRDSEVTGSSQRRPPERYEVASDVSWDRGGTMTDATLRRQHTRSGVAANEPWDRDSEVTGSSQRRPPARYEIFPDVPRDRGGTMTDATLRRQQKRSGAAANEPWDRDSEVTGSSQRRPSARYEVPDVPWGRGSALPDPNLRVESARSGAAANEPWDRDSEVTGSFRRRHPSRYEVFPNIPRDRGSTMVDATLRRRQTRSGVAANEPLGRDSERTGSTHKRPPARYEVASDVLYDRGSMMTNPTLRRQQRRSGVASDELWDGLSEVTGSVRRRPPARSEIPDVPRDIGDAMTYPSLRLKQTRWDRGSEVNVGTSRRLNTSGLAATMPRERGTEVTGSTWREKPARYEISTSNTPRVSVTESSGELRERCAEPEVSVTNEVSSNPLEVKKKKRKKKRKKKKNPQVEGGVGLPGLLNETNNVPNVTSQAGGIEATLLTGVGSSSRSDVVTNVPQGGNDVGTGQSGGIPTEGVAGTTLLKVGGSEGTHPREIESPASSEVVADVLGVSVNQSRGTSPEMAAEMLNVSGSQVGSSVEIHPTGSGSPARLAVVTEELGISVSQGGDCLQTDRSGRMPLGAVDVSDCPLPQDRDSSSRSGEEVVADNMFGDPAPLDEGEVSKDTLVRRGSCTS